MLTGLPQASFRLYKKARFLEARGWRKVSPAESGWRFEHKDHPGIYGVKMALAFEATKIGQQAVEEGVSKIPLPCSCPKNDVGYTESCLQHGETPLVYLR